MVLVYACDITGNGDPDSTPSPEIRYEHQPTTFKITLVCFRTDSCYYDFFYYGYDYSKYTLLMDSVVFNVPKRFLIPDDGHIRFSMLDYYKNEKTYDIDVNPIVHSYRIVDDSVEISFPPEYMYDLYLKKGGRTYESFSADTLPSLRILFNDSNYYNSFGYEVGYNHQGSLQEDSIYISGLVYWDWNK